MQTVASEFLVLLCILALIAMVAIYFKYAVPYLSKNLFPKGTHSSRRKIIEPAKLLLTTTSVVTEYHEFLIPKNDGTSRVIYAPSDALKDIQKNLLGSLNTSLRMPSYVSGFCRGRSLRDNARAHVGKEVVINIDVENFFPSFTLAKVEKALGTLNILKGVIPEAVRMTTYRGLLPQGAPTSPFIANLAFIPVDEAILVLLKKYDPDVGYTRYADDITFSSNNSKIVNAIRIIEDGILPRFGFTAKKKKTCVYRNNTRQTVTGLVVNGKKPRVTRERYMKIRSLVWKELCGKPVVPLSTLKGHLAFLHDADRVGYSKLKKSLSNKVEKSVMRKVFL